MIALLCNDRNIRLSGTRTEFATGKLIWRTPPMALSIRHWSLDVTYPFRIVQTPFYRGVFPNSTPTQDGSLPKREPWSPPQSPFRPPDSRRAQCSFLLCSLGFVELGLNSASTSSSSPDGSSAFFVAEGFTWKPTAAIAFLTHPEASSLIHLIAFLAPRRTS